MNDNLASLAFLELSFLVVSLDQRISILVEVSFEIVKIKSVHESSQRSHVTHVTTDQK